MAGYMWLPETGTSMPSAPKMGRRSGAGRCWDIPLLLSLPVLHGQLHSIKRNGQYLRLLRNLLDGSHQFLKLLPSLLPSVAELLGKTATEVGLDECLRGASHRVLEASFFGGGSRWELRRGAFRQEGRPHQLLVLSDLSRTLREEERQAWKRLVRVLSHEINNSLAPIHSTAGSLKSLVTRDQRATDWEQDLERGLEVIGGRAEALIRFMQSYARLARLPPAIR